ncbi:glycoside hydrolase family 3 protein [Tuber indicum]|nr:glycoside hydrolase family 3 protein [Tuber indicum]
MVGLTSVLLLVGAASLAAAAPTELNIRQSGASTTSPPWYPAPKGGTAASWATAYAKAQALVSQMTLLEKVNITTGTGWAMGPCVGNTGPVPRLGFPSLCLHDGPLGVRFADKITSWPAGITIGGTWNKELFHARGVGLGSEFRAKGVHIALGPAMGPLGRMPAAGRNWEGFGSDPYLQGIASAEHIKGIQSQGVVATAKHYIANEQEHFRQGPGAISSNIDDRTLHEVYLWPFQDSVKAGVGAVMCSYNRVNNSAACQNSYLQNGILKDELGFQGFIMSDWLAQMSGVASVLAGMDMTMPGDGLVWDDRLSLMGPNFTTAALNSSVPLDRIDDMVTRIVATWYKFGQDDGHPEPNFSSWTKNTTGLLYYGSNEPPYAIVNKHVEARGDHANLARKIAAEAIAMLKNEDVLPLKKPMKVGVYGSDAGPGDGPNACPDRGCNQGTLAVGWGSGATDFEYLITPLEAIEKQVGTYGGQVSSVLNNTKLDEIKADAKKQDICLAFVNADAGEGYISWQDVNGDRPNLKTQLGGDDLISAVAEACKTTVVVVHSVGPIIMEEWARSHKVDGILWAHLPGQESGNSLVDVLWGAVNPSGKLPYTIGKSLEDYGPTAGVLYESNGNPPQQDFTEGLLIDYRYFDKKDITPRYEFGFGMSYTTFEFSDLNIVRTGSMEPLPKPRPAPEVTPPTYNSTLPHPSQVGFPPGFTKINRMIYPYLTNTNVTVGPYPYPDGYTTPAHKSEAGGAEGGNPALWEIVYTITHTLKNTGKVAGAEVSQLYVNYGSKDTVEFPERVLRGFEKVFLEPGESKTVTFKLTRRDLSYWDVTKQNWVIPSGGLGVCIGQSSRKFHLRGNLRYGY